MPRPLTSYATSGDLKIAYQVVGDGERDIVFLPGWVSHLELAWDDPHIAYFYRQLSSLGRLIVFDKRGTGLSDPVRGPQTIEQRLDDVRAVMDAAGAERATLFGVSGGGTMALAFAARRPERVTSIVLSSAVACLVATDDHPWGWAPEFFDGVVDAMVEAWGDTRAPGIEFINPSVADDERYREWLGRYMRVSASPAMARDLMWADRSLDVRSLLPGISIPTLVLVRRDEQWINPEEARFITRSLPNAKLVEVAGADHWPWLSHADEVLDAVEEFVTGVRPRRRAAAHQVGVEALSPRQHEVIRLVLHGLTAPQIAAELGVGERTVESHITGAYRKLGVTSKVELLRRYGYLIEA